MKAPRFLLACLLLTPIASLAAATAEPTEASLMADAQRAYAGHDYDTATQLFNEVLDVNPRNTLAIQFLRNIHAQQAGQAPASKDPLKSLVLQKIDFNGATFASALDVLKQKAAEQSVTVSFVTKLSPAQLAQPVTLSLKNVPFFDALRYLCALTGVKISMQRYAIVLSPVAAPVASAAVQ